MLTQCADCNAHVLCPVAPQAGGELSDAHKAASSQVSDVANGDAAGDGYGVEIWCWLKCCPVPEPGMADVQDAARGQVVAAAAHPQGDTGGAEGEGQVPGVGVGLCWRREGGLVGCRGEVEWPWGDARGINR